jgi:hypothetical protein
MAATKADFFLAMTTVAVHSPREGPKAPVVETMAVKAATSSDNRKIILARRSIQENMSAVAMVM